MAPGHSRAVGRGKAGWSSQLGEGVPAPAVYRDKRGDPVGHRQVVSCGAVRYTNAVPRGQDGRVGYLGEGVAAPVVDDDPRTFASPDSKLGAVWTEGRGIYTPRGHAVRVGQFGQGISAPLDNNHNAAAGPFVGGDSTDQVGAVGAPGRISVAVARHAGGIGQQGERIAVPLVDAHAACVQGQRQVGAVGAEDRVPAGFIGAGAPECGHLRVGGPAVPLVNLCLVAGDRQVGAVGAE